MIRPHNLDAKIREVVERDTKEEEEWDVSAAKVRIDGAHYYHFAFEPSADQLVVREDGAVLPVSQIRKVALIANGFNTSIEALANCGESWASKPIVSIYKRYIRVLKRIKKYA